MNDLKIFGGVGRVSVIQAENFSQFEARLIFPKSVAETRAFMVLLVLENALGHRNLGRI